MLIGALLPWEKITLSIEEFTVSNTVSGVEGDGAITLLLALAAINVLAWYHFARGRGLVRGLMLLALGAIISVIAVVDIAEVERRTGVTVSSSVGVGLYVTLIAGIGLAAMGAAAAFFPIRMQVEATVTSPAEPTNKEPD